jgi:hypothetical protein
MAGLPICAPVECCRVRNGGVVAMEYAYNGWGEQVRKHLGAAETQALYDEAGGDLDG